MSAEIVESWRPVLGFEGAYEVSDMGRVRSLDRFAVNSRGARRHIKARVLRAYPAPAGYPTVQLSNGGKMTSRTLHRMVLESFVGPRPEGMVGRHLNGDPLDNRLANLAYGTYRDNALDMIEHGRCHQLNKTECKRGHVLEGWNVISVKNGRKCRHCEYDRLGIPWTGQRQRYSTGETPDRIGLCPNGHVLAEVGLHGNGKKRTCAQCNRDRASAHHQRLRAAKAAVA